MRWLLITRRLIMNNIETRFAYVYLGLCYYKVYLDGEYKFTGTEEDIQDFEDLLEGRL